MRLATLVNGCMSLVQVLAAWVSYDNASSGLVATDVQAAIDEIAAGGVGDDNLDGGFANSNYTIEQCFDGGGA